MATAHGLLNSAGLVLNLLSIRDRATGNRGRGVMLSTVAFGILNASAWMGGEMVYHKRIGVDHSKRERRAGAVAARPRCARPAGAHAKAGRNRGRLRPPLPRRQRCIMPSARCAAMRAARSMKGHSTARACNARGMIPSLICATGMLSMARRRTRNRRTMRACMARKLKCAFDRVRPAHNENRGVEMMRAAPAGEVVVITGASAGVGRATAQAFAERGRTDRSARARRGWA